jgi:hypothetical protein
MITMNKRQLVWTSTLLDKKTEIKPCRLIDYKAKPLQKSSGYYYFIT